MYIFQKWFHHRLLIIAMLIPIVMVLSFIYGLLPGFNNAAKSNQQMPITIVNQDHNPIARTMVKQLKSQLPSKQVTTNSSLKNAKKQLANNQQSLVVVIPRQFSQNAQAGRSVHLNYWTSAASNVMAGNANATAITQINQHVKNALQSELITGMIARQMQPRFQRQLTQRVQNNPQLARQLGGPAGLQKYARQQIMKRARAAARRVTVKYHSNQDQVGQAHSNREYQMAGMFMSMGQYLGIMLAAVVLAWLFSGMRFAATNKFTVYGVLQLTGVVMTFLLSLITVCAVRTLLKFPNFWELWMNNWLIELAIFEFTSALALLCGGLPSLIIQLPLFTTQVIAGGGILPQFALPRFYKWLGAYTPLHSSMQLNAQLIHQLAGSKVYLTSLFSILVWGLIISFLIVWIGYRAKKAQGLAKLI